MVSIDQKNSHSKIHMCSRSLTSMCAAIIALFLSLQSSPSLADELSYLLGAGENRDINIMILMDSSASLSHVYGRVSGSDPTASPLIHNHAIELSNTKNLFESQLKYTDIIPSTLSYLKSEQRCAHAREFIGESYASACTEMISDSRWYLRKLEIVKVIIKDTIPLFIGTNVGFMRTNRNSQGHYEWRSRGRSRVIDERSLTDHSRRGENGSYPIVALQPLTTISEAQDIAQKLETSYTKLNGPQLTPMTESLYEAYTYFLGEQSPWEKSPDSGWDSQHLPLLDSTAFENDDPSMPYKPILKACSSNHAVIVTDGAPTYDWQANDFIADLTGATVTPPNPMNFNSEDTRPEHTMLDEFAGYLARTDLDSSLLGKQNITTHFISTWASSDSNNIIDEAVSKSGGFHYGLSDISELHEAFTKLIADIKNSSAPAIGYNVLAISQTGSPFESKDQASVNIWEKSNGRWIGNLKKYAIGENGNLVSGSNTPLIQNDNSINPNSQSLWSSIADGDQTLIGGAGNKLSSIGTKRYTVPNAGQVRNVRLTNPQFLISDQNQGLKAELLGATDDAEKDDLLLWLSGVDVYDADLDGDTTDIRTSLGDQPNVQPAVAYYSDGSRANPVIFTGTNEGFLHSFDSDTGEHLYSFFVPHFLPLLNSNVHSGSQKFYGLDGNLHVAHFDKNNDFNLMQSPARVDQGESLMLYFGLRRGGRAFYALDITDRGKPKFGWTISHETPGFQRLGETWASPATATIRQDENNSRDVVILSGGFDPGIADNTAMSPHIGNSVYILDAQRGTKLWSISNQNADIKIPEMKYSIVGKPLALDLNKDGQAETVIFNDIRGQVFRCDLSVGQNDATQIICRLLAQAQEANENLWFYGNIDAAMAKHSGSATGSVLALTLISGNRMDPTDASEQNRLVVFFAHSGPLADQQRSTEIPRQQNQSQGSGSMAPSIELSDLVNVSSGAADTTLSAKGWYLDFGAAGEKGFSQTIIVDGSIFFSTFSPSINSTAQASCSFIDMGEATVYGLRLLQGDAIPDLNYTEDQGVLWKGEARGIPSTPYAIANTASEASSININLGVDQTSISLDIEPVQRTYWYQSD